MSLARTVLDLLIASNDPRFTEDIAHLEHLITEADANMSLTKPSTADNIQTSSKGGV